MSLGHPWSRRGRQGRTPMRDRSAVRDEQLIRSLYAEHGRSLLAYATRLTGDRTAAEDVVQETLLRAWKHADAMSDNKGSVRGWLLTVARNIVIDRARASAVRPREVEQTAEAVPVQRDHAQGVVDSISVLSALNTLTPEHREILFELYYNGGSMNEVAQRLGIPPGTVKSRSYYALRAMSAAIGDRADAEAAK